MWRVQPKVVLVSLPSVLFLKTSEANLHEITVLTDEEVNDSVAEENTSDWLAR